MPYHYFGGNLMKYFAINNLSACEKVEGYMSNLDSFVKVVEDNLYTYWELTPSAPCYDLLNGKVVQFDYHGVEFYDVWVDETTGIVMVADADLDLEFDDCDYECGFDPYEGCYTDDC